MRDLIAFPLLALLLILAWVPKILFVIALVAMFGMELCWVVIRSFGLIVDDHTEKLNKWRNKNV